MFALSEKASHGHESCRHGQHDCFSVGGHLQQRNGASGDADASRRRRDEARVALVLMLAVALAAVTAEKNF